MRRCLLLLALAVLAGGASNMAQADDPTRDDDGRHRVAVMLDPSTGEFIFAGNIDMMSQALPLSSSPQGSQVEMLHVATVSASIKLIVSSQKGFDSDHDGRAEFVIGKNVGDIWTTVFEFFESLGDDGFNDSFELVQVLPIPPDGISSYISR